MIDDSSDDDGADANVCGVCFDKVVTRGKLDRCEHMFCFECISEWAKVENTCPHCKVCVRARLESIG